MLRFSPYQLPPITPELSAYEREALEFCYQWQSGQSSFTLHTSGSTGQPKPIELTRTQMQASAHLTGQALGLRARDRALVGMNIHFIAGTMMLVRGMELGLEMTIVPPSRNPLSAFSYDDRFDFTALVPLQLQTILHESPEKLVLLHSMKAILLGGAPVSYALENELQVIEAPVYSTYGMTETVSHIALRRLNGPNRSEWYTALTDVELGLDERGCLWIVAPVTNYQRVQTNDLVDLREHRTFRWLGRADHVINSGGVKIGLEKVERHVEKVLADWKIDRRFVALGIPHPALGEALCLAMEGTPLSMVQENRLTEALTQTLDRYEIPKRTFYVPIFPETPTSKIDRKVISELVQQMTSEQ